ncbi:1452_t:CDS:1, partial [Cetraspora pellucida]
GRRIYEHGQRSEVVLISESNILLNNKNPEMIIIWQKRIINDEGRNKSEAGW